MSGCARVGQEKLRIWFRVPEDVDITNATGEVLHYKKPGDDGATGTFTPVEKDVSLNWWYYDTGPNDLDEAGNWLFQVYAELPDYNGFKGRSDEVKLIVKANIS